MNGRLVTDLVAAIDRDKDEMLEFLARLIRIPSFKGQEADIARFLGNYFDQRGYEVEIQEVAPGRLQTISTLKGSGGGKSLMFNGHIDMDPLADGWAHDPWTPRIAGDRMYGAGSFNMKGGVAAMVFAAEQLRKSRAPLEGDVVVACVAGELSGGDGTVHMLDRGIRTDMAVVAECFGTESIATVHVGVLHMAVHTLGTTKHVRYPEGSVDAIEKMQKVIGALSNINMTYEPRNDLPGMPVFHVGGVIGGLGREYNLADPYYISNFCTAVINVHFVHGQTPESIADDVRQALAPLADEDPELKFEIEIPVPKAIPGSRQRIMEPFDLPKDEHIVGVVSRAHELATGSPPKSVGAVLPLSYSANDTIHLWNAGIPCVIYGPTGGESEPDAYVLISQMTQCAKVLALSALDVCS